MKDKNNFFNIKKCIFNELFKNYFFYYYLRNSLQKKLKSRHWYFFLLNVYDYCEFLVDKKTIMVPSLIRNNEH